MRGSMQFADATSGVVYIHSSPAALCPHIEWALAATLRAPAGLRWLSQPSAAGRLRSTVDWIGPVGTGARLATALQDWPQVYFEVTEDPSDGVDGERFSYVPGLGLWRGTTSANGDVMVGEMRLREIVRAGGDATNMAAAVDRALGTVWDSALEPFRAASAPAHLTLLRRDVG